MELLTEGFEILITNPVPRPFERLEKTPAVNRLEQIIERLHLESPQRVFVISGDENDLRHPPRADGLDHPEPVEPGHLNVEKHQVGGLAQDGRHGLAPAPAFANHFNIRLALKPAVNPLARQLFIINNQYSNLFHGVISAPQL